MNKQKVEQIIKDLARDNFNLYSENYIVENGMSTEESTINAQEVAISYCDNRTKKEIERDESLNITKIEYVDWVMEEYSVYLHGRILN